MNKQKLILFLILLLSVSCLSSAQNTTEKLIRINGTEIFTKILGKGESIVILHGGPGLAHNYLYEPFKQLSNSYKLIFYDQRGCGKSSGFKQDEIVSIETLVEDLETIRKEFNIDKMILVGQSWGAIIALNYSIDHPNNIKKLLLLEPAPGSSEYLLKIQRTIMDRLSQSNKERLIKISQTPELKANPDLFKEFLKIRFHTYFYDSTFAAYLHMDYFDSTYTRKFFESSSMFSSYLINFNLYDKMNSITVPTLIIHGDYDVIPNESIERMSKAISDSKLNIVKNCGHFVHLEKQELYFNTIKSFLMKE